MSTRMQRRVDELARTIGQATSIQTWRPIWECLTSDELDRVEDRMNRLARHESATTPVRDVPEFASELVSILKTAAARTGTSNVAGSVACLVAAADLEMQLGTLWE